MKVLIVGAGSIGGYFGAKLLQAGRDVTFLVRERRATLLAERGLNVISPIGNISIKAPSTLTAKEITTPFDLILLSCKAYDLGQAMDDFGPAVGENSLILPLLNGMKHLDILDERFGRDKVLGGLCMISTVLEEDGTIKHLNDSQILTFGARANNPLQAVAETEGVLSDAGFDLRVSDAIIQNMWEKWAFITATAALTSLMRAPVGDIVSAGGGEFATLLLDEICDIAEAAGFGLPTATKARSLAMLSEPGSLMNASLSRDMERGGRIEADHLIGDMLARKGRSDPHSLLQISYLHMKTYEARQARELAEAN